MNKIYALITLSIIMSMGYASENKPNNSVKILPAMKGVSRDWEYFKTVPCDQLKKIVFHDEIEKILLDKKSDSVLMAIKLFCLYP